MPEIIIYTQELDNNRISEWEGMFLEEDMEVQIHPNFSFQNQKGFLPFSVEINSSKYSILNDRKFLSGFEMDVEDYNYQHLIAEQFPKESLFKKLFGNRQERYIANPDVDSILNLCSNVITIRWSASEILEFRMAMFSCIALSTIFDGVIYDPEDDQWIGSIQAQVELKQYVSKLEKSIPFDDWNLHTFEKWL